MIGFSLCASGLLNSSAVASAEAAPRASFVFRPVQDGVVRDENGNEHTATVNFESGDGWVDTDQGPALELKGERDRVDLSPFSFPGVRGSMQITFRPDLEGEKTQYLFRVYHGNGDGLTLYLRAGALTFRYHNRATNTNITATLPPGAVPQGAWTTATASWDFENERRILIRTDEKRKVARAVDSDMQIGFDPSSRVIIGNEHVGSAPFLGAIHSVKIFDEPLWDQTADSPAKKKSPADLPKVTRQRVLPRTLFFSRSQPKYDLFSNPLMRRWVDRPLFFDRRTEASEKPYSIVTAASFLKNQESLHAYGLDGFGSLLASLPFQGTAFLEMLDSADQSPEKCVPLVMEVAGSSTEEEAAHRLELFLPLAERALRSPNVLRVNGKILVLSYAVDGAPLANWTKVRDGVRERFGDKFLFIADVTTRRPALLREFQELNGISSHTLEDFRKHLRAWLDASDGIMWAGGSHTNRPDGTLDRAFYRDFLVPTFSGVLNEQPYRAKLLGLDAEVGYINVMTSRKVNSEEQTRRLRDNLEIAFEANPDFIAMPEWDELNENTSVGPTLTNSLSTQRIIRYTIEKFAGRENKPLAGDDTSIPNLIVSFRPYLKLGEPLEIEVLSIPESAASGVIAVELSLKNLAGEVIQTFSKATLAADRMVDHLFTVPSETLASEPVLIPSLKVTAADGRTSHWEDGLEAIRLSPSWNLNYKATKIPLRDLLQPENASFRILPGETAEGVKVEGNIACDEQIASVEVVQDSRELYALDPKKELVPGPEEALIMLNWQAMRNPLPFSGTIEVKQGELRKFVDWTRPEYKRASYKLAAAPDAEGQQTVRFTTDSGVNSTNARGGFFIIGNPEEAILSMKTNLFNLDIPVKEILSSGKVARVFPGGLTVEASLPNLLPQIPFPLLTKEATFTTTVRPWRKDSPLQMRVVTTSGKIFRSRPLLPHPHAKNELALSVWSETQNAPITVSVSSSRIPDIAAQIMPRHGASVHTTESDYFYGFAGGVPFDMGAFSKRHLRNSYPASSPNTSPAWVVEGGDPCLKFDGKGTVIYFPEETLPRGSFTLEFEIKPTGSRPQILCTNRGYHRGALTLTLTKGELGGQWLDRQNKVTPLQTGLFLPQGEWARVVITYDLTSIRFSVNGKSVTIPCPDGIAQSITPFIFGGYGTGKDFAYFSGFLKAIRFRHANVVQEPSQTTGIQAPEYFKLASFSKTW